MQLRTDDGFLELDKASRKSLRQTAERLGIGPHDLLLIGDGTGSAYTTPMGWACTAYDRARKRAVVHLGAATTGTVGVAELYPFVHALWFFHQERGNDEKERTVRVAVVSDSEVTVRCGNWEYARRANACFWAGVEWFEQNGYCFAWHHVRRRSEPWNAFADSLSQATRRLGVTLKELANAELAGTSGEIVEA